MAKRDFATAHNHDVAPSNSLSSMRIVIIVSLVLLLAISFAAGFWLGGETEKQLNNNEERSQLLHQIMQQQQEIKELKLAQVKSEKERLIQQKKSEQATHPLTDVGPLTFYNDLPKQSVTPVPLTIPNHKETKKKTAEDILRQELKTPSATPTVLATTAHKGQTYRLQVGSFQQKKDAGELKKRLAKIDNSATVMQSEIKNRGTWYRVFMGPYLSRNEAELAHKDIQQKMHITGLIVEINSASSEH
ncbi:MAG: SPOR domain-containing protein [Mariprofundaceae bacterium]